MFRVEYCNTMTESDLYKFLLFGFSPFMMTSSNGNIFCVTGPLCGEFTGHRWLPLTKASDAELWYYLWSQPWINSWVNNREAGDLRRHRAHYDVIVIFLQLTWPLTSHVSDFIATCSLSTSLYAVKIHPRVRHCFVMFMAVLVVLE